MLDMKEIPITETYFDVEKLIHSTAHRFAKRFGGDHDELFAEANVAYMKAYKAFDIKRGLKFSTLLVTCIWNHLLNVTSRASHKKRKELYSLDVEILGGDGITGADVTPDRPDLTFNYTDFVGRLSCDGKFVVDLIFDAPEEVRVIAKDKGDEPRNWRSTVRAYLADLGWSAARVAESFDEIKGVL